MSELINTTLEVFNGVDKKPALVIHATHEDMQKACLSIAQTRNFYRLQGNKTQGEIDGTKFSTYGVIQSLGKFEHETLDSLYYYDCFLNGGESVFEVSDEERKAFHIGDGYKFAFLYESDCGFVHVCYYATREEADFAAGEESEGDFTE